MLGLGCLVLLRCFDDARRWWPFGLALAGLMPLAALVADQSRVLAIATFPLIAVYWLFNPAALDLLPRRAAALLALAWVVTPWLWFWAGRPRWSATPYDLAWPAHWLTGWPKLPEGLFGWPFL